MVTVKEFDRADHSPETADALEELFTAYETKWDAGSLKTVSFEEGKIRLEKILQELRENIQREGASLIDSVSTNRPAIS